MTDKPPSPQPLRQAEGLIRVRDPRHSRRAVARSDHRRGDAADLRHLHVQAVLAGRAHGLRVRAHAEPHAHGLRALHRRSGGRRARVRLRLRPGGHGAPCWSCWTQGSHIVAVDDMYGGSWRLFERVRKRSMGLRVSYVDPDAPGVAGEGDPAGHQDDLGRNALQSAAQGHRSGGRSRRSASARGILTVCDNTFASPWLQRPLELGFDIVVHSVTKYINGHSDMVGGIVVVGDNRDLTEKLEFMQNAIGSILDPFASFLALRGVKTLPLRMQQHCGNAHAPSRTGWTSHPKIERVIYPGLPNHPQHAARGQADERLRRHDRGLPEDRPGRHPPRSGALRAVHAGRKPGRRRKPDRPSGDS